LKLTAGDSYLKKLVLHTGRLSPKQPPALPLVWSGLVGFGTSSSRRVTQ